MCHYDTTQLGSMCALLRGCNQDLAAARTLHLQMCHMFAWMQQVRCDSSGATLSVTVLLSRVYIHAWRQAKCSAYTMETG